MKLNTNQLGQSCTAAQVKETSCGAPAPSLVVIKEFKTSALVTDCDEDVQNNDEDLQKMKIFIEENIMWGPCTLPRCHQGIKEFKTSALVTHCDEDVLNLCLGN